MKWWETGKTNQAKKPTSRQGQELRGFLSNSKQIRRGSSGKNTKGLYDQREKKGVLVGGALSGRKKGGRFAKKNSSREGMAKSKTPGKTGQTTEKRRRRDEKRPEKRGTGIVELRRSTG